MPAVLSVLCLLCMMLRVGPSLSSCNLTVSTLDLRCRLQWACSDLSSSTTFTVQAKAHGEWQNVSGCIQISSHSCDVSQAITDFVLFNFIRLDIIHGDGKTEQSASEICDPLKDPEARFSPPSVSVSLKENRLQVEVAFACLLSTECQEEEEEDDKDTAQSCCPVTYFLRRTTTVTLYNKRNAADTQTLSEVFTSGTKNVEFGSLMEGQEYCAKARFASSPFSDPQCVHIPSPESLNLAVLCGVLIALLLVVMGVLVRQCASYDDRLPKSLLSLQNMDHESPFVAESGQTEEEENSLVLLTIMTSSSLSSISETQLTGSHTHSLENGYYASHILQHQTFEDLHEDTEGSNVETDGPTSVHHYPRNICLSDSTHTTDPACSLEASSHQGDSFIPLKSVRVAWGQREEIELDHLPKILMNVNISGGSP